MIFIIRFVRVTFRCNLNVLIDLFHLFFDENYYLFDSIEKEKKKDRCENLGFDFNVLKFP